MEATTGSTATSQRSSSIMDPSQSWWKVTFLKKKPSQPKVLYQLPAEFASSPALSGVPPHPEGGAQDSGLDARLERILDKSTATKGRHVKVSHSGRYVEKKRMRATLADNPDMFTGVQPSRELELHL